MNFYLKKGSALLSALFIMTLVAIAATAMSTRLQLDIYRTGLLLSSDKLLLASQGVTFWSMDLLSQDKNKLSKAKDNGKVADLPRKFESMYPQLKIKGELYDLQSRFNLNNLTSLKASNSFVNLMANIIPDMQPAERDALARQLFYWLNNYDQGRGQDKFLTYYIKQNPPYNPSHLPMVSQSELRLLKGVTPAMALKLAPYITALPEQTPININTAPKQVLMSLGNGLNNTKVSELIQARGDSGFAKMDALNPLLEKLAIPSQQITLESSYFLSVAYVSDSNLRLICFALLKKSRNRKNKVSVSLIRESVNTI